MYDSPATLPIIQQLIYKYRNFLRFLTCSRHDINNNLIEQSQEPVNKASDCTGIRSRFHKDWHQIKASQRLAPNQGFRETGTRSRLHRDWHQIKASQRLQSLALFTGSWLCSIKLLFISWREQVRNLRKFLYFQSLWSLDLVPVSLKPWFGASLCEALIWCQSLWNLDLMPVSVKSWSGGICKILGENNNNILRHTISSTTYIYCHQSL
jgi:hypothetical protein